LHISDSKTEEYAKPIITNITIAKTQITDLLNQYLQYKVSDNESDDAKKWHISLDANDLITHFKIVIHHSSIQYKDILNYALGVVERRTVNIVETYKEDEKKSFYTEMIINFFTQLLDFVFFIYSVSPRVTATIKIVSLLSKILEFINTDKKNEKSFKNYQIEFIYKKIYDEIFQILKKNKFKKYTQNETLYLLITLNELGKDYRLDNVFLEEYFFSDNIKMNYFVITTLFYYTKQIKRYSSIHQKLKSEIKSQLENYNKNNLKKNTEYLLLLLDMLTCPYLDNDFKKELLNLFGITDITIQDKIIEFSLQQKYWFIKWQDLNLAEEIEIKRSKEVYS